MTDRRPILLGMSNPISSDPAHALYPWPAGCAGFRLWYMLNSYSLQHASKEILQADYIMKFDRRNLVAGQAWSVARGRAAGDKLLPELGGRTIVILGAQTLKAMGFPKHTWGEWVEMPASYSMFLSKNGQSMRWCVLPHPSGLSRLYNDPAMVELAGRTLFELYQQSTGGK